MGRETRAPSQPPISDYGLIADGNGAALVSQRGSIDWCCVPRLDSASCFGRLLDWERGGHCSIEPAGENPSVAGRDYVGSSLVLEATLRTEGGEARLRDCMTVDEGGRPQERCELVRVVEGVRGSFELAVRVEPRFDYGTIDAWIRHHGTETWTAIGGDAGLLIWSDVELEFDDDRQALAGLAVVRPGERVRLSISSCDPAELDELADAGAVDPAGVDRRLEETIAFWRRWAETLSLKGPDAAGNLRSALVLRALTYRPTGAIAAAATTSLPEVPGGERNWDYRFSWIRDAALAVRSLAELGCEDEADGFRRFVERSAAGNAKDLQVMFGIAGEHRIGERVLDGLAGYDGARPVRAGNDASGQLQLDAFGHMLDQSWRWYGRGHEPDDDYWRFLVDLVEAAVEHWREPDAGIWEWPGKPKHFVHSKAMCWAAVDRGLRLAEACMRKAPERRWRGVRDEIRAAIEGDGYDSKRGIFVQAFGERGLDAALLRLPTVDFIAYDDERMIRTTDAIRERLETGGLLRRYDADDGLPGSEGAFVACVFWLAEVLARQGRIEEARDAFDRAIATANGLGLLSEEYDPERRLMLGNFPQALSHLSHLEASIALAETEAPPGSTVATTAA
jgi:GH15 family glucan-1,4-alpha-glucosidase